MSHGCIRNKLADHSVCTSAVAGTSGCIAYSNKSNIMRKTTFPNKINMEEAYTELREKQVQEGELCQILRKRIVFILSNLTSWS
jgi:hypothetical protein